MSANLNQCPRCNVSLQPGARYCPNCSYDLAAAPPMAPPSEPSTSGPAATAPSGYSLSDQAKQRIMEAINRRGQTDEMIPEWWILLPILVILLVTGFSFIGIFVNIPAIVVISVAVSFIAPLLILILIYKLLKRHNLHMAREAALRRGIIDFLRFKAEERAAGYQVAQYTQAMETIDRDGLIVEKPQDALLWTILCVIPIINYVAYILIAYWLTNFSPGHDRRFFAFAQNTQYAGNQIGMQNILPQMWRPVPDRSFLLYIVLTIITLGLFAIYWAYVLIKDLNEHFKNEWEFEDALARELQKA